MATDPNVLTYIKNALAEGKTKQDITNGLITQGGWSHMDVDEAFATIAIQTPPPMVQPVMPAPISQVVSTPRPVPIEMNSDFVDSKPKGHGALFSVIGLVAIIIVGVGGYFYWQMTQSNVSKVIETVATSTQPVVLGEIATSTLMWAPYANPTYKYQVQYPTTFSTTSTAGGYAEVFIPTSVLAVQYPTTYFAGTNIDSATVIVGSIKTDQKTCQAPSGSAEGMTEVWKQSPISINGIPYFASHTAEGAAGHSYSTYTYSTFKDALCYRALLVVSSFNDIAGHNADHPEDQVMQGNAETQLIPTFDSIVGTISFSVETTAVVAKPVTTKVATTNTAGGINCGTSKSTVIMTDASVEAYYDKDAVLQCMGKNILNNCTIAHALVGTDRLDVLKSGTDCLFKLTKSTGSGSNTCNLNKLTTYAQSHPSAQTISFTNPQAHLGSYAGTLYNVAIFSPFAGELSGICSAPTIDVNKVNADLQTEWKNNLKPLQIPQTTIWKFSDHMKNTVVTIPEGDSYTVPFADGSVCSVSKAERLTYTQGDQDNIMILRTVDCTGTPILTGNASFQGRTNTVGCHVAQSYREQGVVTLTNYGKTQPGVDSQSFVLTCEIGS